MIISYIMAGLLPFALGVLLDLVFGDPPGVWHPVQGIGALITFFESCYRRLLKVFFPDNTSETAISDHKAAAKTCKIGLLAAGGFMLVSVLTVTGTVTGGLLFFAYRLHPLAGLLTESYLCYTMLAARSLRTESMRVGQALAENDLEAGRKAVSWIVGRDTKTLTEAGVMKAAVETVAENTTDGVIAPMFFWALAGPVGGYLYKAVNTMDSMTGYKNERYLYFGRIPAYTDDVCNYVPARLSAILMLAAAAFLRMQPGEALRIYRRDKKKHESPNAAHTEAVMAGALGIQLAGDAVYFGKLVQKPFIGDARRPVELSDIERANRLMYGTAALGAILCSILRGTMILLSLKYIL